MRAALNVAVLGLAVGLLSGCGGESGGQNTPEAPAATTTTTTAAKTTEPTEEPEAEGLSGTWEPINESPIATLTITGTTAQTTGDLACPGTVADPDSAKPVLTLTCATPDDERTRGTLELKPDGSALFITWDGPSWGGAIDSLKRAG